MCERGEPDAGAIGGKAEGAGDSHVAGSDAVEAGTTAIGGEPGAGFRGRGDRHVDHFLDRRIHDEIHAADGLSVPAESAGGPGGADGDGSYFAADRFDFWD